MRSDDIGHLLKNDDDDFRSRWCGHIRESSIENHVQPLVDSISTLFLHFLFEEKKNLITKWSSLFSLKTEGEWWNSNSIFAFFFFHYYDIFRKRENYNLSLYACPKADWERRCVSFSFFLKSLFVFIARLYWRFDDDISLYCIAYIQTKSDE